MNERYSRQILFDKIGKNGQQKIESSNVTIVGMGALGTHVAEQLVRAGVKRINIIDRDYVEVSNLQRQTLFVEKDVLDMLPKVVAAKKHLLKMNADATIKTYIAHCDAKLLDEVAKYSDIIIDATDNFNTRFVINDFSYKMKIPWIYGACLEAQYVETAFVPGKTPCFHCVMREIPTINRTCDTVGVIMPAVAITASLQVTDTMKILTDKPFTSKLTYGDVWSGEHQSFSFTNVYNSSCTTCSEDRTFPYLTEKKERITELCGRETVQYINEKLNRQAIERFINQRGLLHKSNAYMVQFKYDHHRVVAFNKGRLLIHGIETVEEGKKFIEKMFG